MATETQYQVTSRTPEVEAYELELLKAAQKMTDKAMFDERFAPAPYQIAGFSPMEQQAFSMAQQGVGSYVPYLQQATNSIGGSGQFIADAAVPTLAQGQQYAQEAGRLAQQLREVPYKYQTAAGEGLLASAGTFDPAQTDAFMNPYTEEVIDIAQADIDEQAAANQQQLAANAVASGAFGGSRSGVMASRAARDMEREKARIGSQLRASGYESARRAAQDAFENTQNRRLAASQGIGNLGLQFGQLSQGDIDQMRGIGSDLQTAASGYGNLAQQGANIGVQQAALGESAQTMLGRDIAQMGQLGAQQRAMQQAGLDAQRMTQTEARNQPFQQLAFMGDIVRGVPSTQQTMISNEGGGGSASPLQQLLGFGTGLYATQKALGGLGSMMP
jgi:hypothetical protein